MPLEQGELVVGLDEDAWVWIVSPYGAEVLTQWKDPETVADALLFHGLDRDRAVELFVDLARSRRGIVSLYAERPAW